MKFLDIELERIYQGFQLGEVSGIEYALDVADRDADGMATDAELAAAWDAARAAAWDAAWDASAAGDAASAARDAARDTQKKKLIEILTGD